MARRTVVINNRGGVGKSDVTLRLGAALAKRGRRVGLLDFDPQGNLSRRAGWTYNEAQPQVTVSEAVQSNRVGAMRQVWTPVNWDIEYADRMRLAPAWLELENRYAEAGVPSAHLRLAKALQGADDDLDHVLIDCPPSLFHLTQMAFAAGDGVLLVTRAEIDAILGARRVREFIAEHKVGLHADDLTIDGVIVNDYEQARPRQRQQLESIRRIFGDLVWDPIIGRREIMANASNDHVPLEQAKGSQLQQAVAGFELLADTYEKRTAA
ncbi:ParA family protein [Streptomyces sp. NPDC090303]|uniref:ParA family protein n=1 Tax=Streptomyces sp. NPDC090303 TaxID=3365960 RepID=UPI0037F75C98